MTRADVLRIVERIHAAADILAAGSPVAMARHQLTRDLAELERLAEGAGMT